MSAGTIFTLVGIIKLSVTCGKYDNMGCDAVWFDYVTQQHAVYPEDGNSVLHRDFSTSNKLLGDSQKNIIRIAM